MDADILLVTGLVIGVFAIPAMVSAYSDGRPPRVAALALVLAAGLVAWAAWTKPGGYALADIPEAIASVAGRVLH